MEHGKGSSALIFLDAAEQVTPRYNSKDIESAKKKAAEAVVKRVKRFGASLAGARGHRRHIRVLFEPWQSYAKAAQVSGASSLYRHEQKDFYLGVLELCGAQLQAVLDELDDDGLSVEITTTWMDADREMGVLRPGDARFSHVFSDGGNDTDALAGVQRELQSRQLHWAFFGSTFIAVANVAAAQLLHLQYILFYCDTLLKDDDQVRLPALGSDPVQHLDSLAPLDLAFAHLCIINATSCTVDQSRMIAASIAKDLGYKGADAARVAGLFFSLAARMTYATNPAVLAKYREAEREQIYEPATRVIFRPVPRKSTASAPPPKRARTDASPRPSRTYLHALVLKDKPALFLLTKDMDALIASARSEGRSSISEAAARSKAVAIPADGDVHLLVAVVKGLKFTAPKGFVEGPPTVGLMRTWGFVRTKLRKGKSSTEETRFVAKDSGGEPFISATNDGAWRTFVTRGRALHRRKEQEEEEEEEEDAEEEDEEEEEHAEEEDEEDEEDAEEEEGEEEEHGKLQTRDAAKVPVEFISIELTSPLSPDLLVQDHRGHMVLREMANNLVLSLLVALGPSRVVEKVNFAHVISGWTTIVMHVSDGLTSSLLVTPPPAPATPVCYPARATLEQVVEGFKGHVEAFAKYYLTAVASAADRADLALHLSWIKGSRTAAVKEFAISVSNSFIYTSSWVSAKVRAKVAAKGDKGGKAKRPRLGLRQGRILDLLEHYGNGLPYIQRLSKNVGTMSMTEKLKVLHLGEVQRGLAALGHGAAPGSVDFFMLKLRANGFHRRYAETDDGVPQTIFHAAKQQLRDRGALAGREIRAVRLQPGSLYARVEVAKVIAPPVAAAVPAPAVKRPASTPAVVNVAVGFEKGRFAALAVFEREHLPLGCSVDEDELGLLEYQGTGAVEEIATSVIKARAMADGKGDWEQIKSLLPELEAAIRNDGFDRSTGTRALALVSAAAAASQAVLLARAERTIGSDPAGLLLEANLKRRQALCRALHGLQVVRGLGKNLYTRPIGAALARVVVVLERVCAPFRDQRIRVNAKTASCLRAAAGALERKVNCLVKARLADAEFAKGQPHYARALQARKLALEDPEVSHFTVGSGHWQRRLEYRARHPKVDEALRVLEVHAASTVASDIKSKLLGHLRGREDKPTVVFHDLKTNRHAPLPYRFGRRVLKYMARPQTAPGPRGASPTSSFSSTTTTTTTTTTTATAAATAAAASPASKRAHTKDNVQIGGAIANPQAKQKLKICLCGKPHVSGDQVWKHEVQIRVPGGIYKRNVFRQIRRPDGASCGDCCTKGIVVVGVSQGPDGHTSSPSFLPAVSRLGQQLFGAVLALD